MDQTYFKQINKLFSNAKSIKSKDEMLEETEVIEEPQIKEFVRALWGITPITSDNPRTLLFSKGDIWVKITKHYYPMEDVVECEENFSGIFSDREYGHYILHILLKSQSVQ